jgi:glucosyl-3-phosphoglycerate synthase
VVSVHPAAREWFARRTHSWQEWSLPQLLSAKAANRVSVVLPALDEEDTVGAIVAGIRPLRDAGLVDELLVIDSGSADRTAAQARAAGATVVHRDDVLPGEGSLPGKGEVLWKALAATTGDILVYVDADLTDFRAHFVTGLLGPLLTDPSVHLVKAFYDRPLLDVSAAGGGRVTELAARPLLGAYFPELAGVVQPLAGEYAARRKLLEQLPFAAGYGVETGLLVDAWRAAGLAGIAQVDLGQRTHGHQDTAALGRMAATILHTVLHRAAQAGPADPADPQRPLWTTLTQFRRGSDGRIEPVERDVAGPDRPPMVTVAEYRRRPAAAPAPH